MVGRRRLEAEESRWEGAVDGHRLPTGVGVRGFSGHFHMSSRDLGINFFCAGKGYRDPLRQAWESALLQEADREWTGSSSRDLREGCSSGQLRG